MYNERKYTKDNLLVIEQLFEKTCYVHIIHICRYQVYFLLK